MTTSQETTYAQRNEDIAKDYLGDPSLTLRAVGEKYGLSADRVRLIVLEVSGLSPTEVAERRSQSKIAGIVERANALLDEDESITRTSDLFHPLGVSNEFVRSHSDELSEVLGRIKGRRHINDNKVGNKYSDDAILDAIRASYKESQKAVKAGKEVEFKYFTLPLYDKYRAAGTPTRATIVNRMGWNEACERIGEFPHIKPRGMKPRISEDDALDALEACSNDLGKDPMLVTMRDYEEWHSTHREYPYVLSIRKRFNRKWNEAAVALKKRSGEKRQMKKGA